MVHRQRAKSGKAHCAIIAHRRGDVGQQRLRRQLRGYWEASGYRRSTGAIFCTLPVMSALTIFTPSSAGDSPATGASGRDIADVDVGAGIRHPERIIAR